tara:strand:- start:172 stop:510 length:339 start_codon:yes stop_codon:yes gene_type:complete
METSGDRVQGQSVHVIRSNVSQPAAWQSLMSGSPFNPPLGTQIMESQIFDWFSLNFTNRFWDVDGVGWFLNRQRLIDYLSRFRIRQLRQTEKVVQSTAHDTGSEVKVQVIFG